MKVIHKPVHLPHLRPIHKTNEGGGHPIDRKPMPDSRFFRRPPPKKGKKK